MMRISEQPELCDENFRFSGNVEKLQNGQKQSNYSNLQWKLFSFVGLKYRGTSLWLIGHSQCTQKTCKTNFPRKNQRKIPSEHHESPPLLHFRGGLSTNYVGNRVKNFVYQRKPLLFRGEIYNFITALCSKMVLFASE